MQNPGPCPFQTGNARALRANMDRALPSYARVNLHPDIDEILILDELETTEERD